MHRFSASEGTLGRRKRHAGVSALIRRDVQKNRYVYFMALPVIAYYAIFHYGPMYGLIIAFMEYRPALGLGRSEWVGLGNFISFFNDYSFFKVIRNTFLINVYDILFGFPIPIVFALLLNEVRSSAFRRTVQTATYLPHFISIVVMCGIIKDFCDTDGVVVHLLSTLFGMKRTNLLSQSQLFRSIFIVSNIWQHFGWNSIIYIAALAGVDVALYEAAIIDGAGRFKQMVNITLPGILPTIVIMFILRLGQMMSVGFEKVILLYNPLTYETADVIQSFVYRRGLLNYDYSFSSAVGLFNSVINFALVYLANRLSREYGQTSLW